MITAHCDNQLQNRNAFQARAAFSARLAGGQAQFDAHALDSSKAVTPVASAEIGFVDQHEHTVKPELNYSALVMLQERQDYAELIAGKKFGASILKGKPALEADNAAQNRARHYLMAFGQKLIHKAEHKNAAEVQAESFMAAYGSH